VADPRAARAEPVAPSDSGRHHRPETLADVTRWRPAPATPGIRRRSADEVPGFIERGYPEDLTRAQRRRQADAIHAARRRQGVSTRREAESGRGKAELERRKAESGRRKAEFRRRKAEFRRRSVQTARPSNTGPAKRGRGKHAAGLDITVRPLPVVRDAMVNARDWAMTPGERPPVGGHRAPGTLPIESWLLVGRGRQQALLATLVAIGLALVMIPIERHVDVNPIAAADRTITQAGPAHRSAPKTTAPAARPTRTSGHKTGNKAATTPSAEPSTPPAEPAAVPPGTGPAQSLKVTGSNAIALTFDDGPDPVQTPKILALLDKYQVKATFCLIGTNVEKHPEIVREIVADGHTLCNHTWNHSLVIGQDSTATIRADLERTTAAIHAAAPGAPIPFFRAPGGNFTDRLVSEAYGEGMTSLYWQVDPQDWNHLPLETDTAHVGRVIRTVRATVRPGSIILSHDFNQPDTIEAYEQLLPYLTQRFTTTVPVAPAVSASPAASPPASPAPDDGSVSDPPKAGE
jgi:peptidoglycan/xylan/chitin deacetylase (PgdA/CDA1 family)